jgi:activator of HSP90 ATPase
MNPESLNYHQFVQGIEASGNFYKLEKMAQISQMRRRSSNYTRCSQNATQFRTSNISSRNSQNTTVLSICSSVSIKSVTPSASDSNSALYQKGFELRQFDSDKEFDQILEQGYHSINGDQMPTLRLTLTPDILRR